MHSENVNFFGAIEGELAQHGPTGYRPLWVRDSANDPQFSAVAGLRNLAQKLLSNAENVGGGD